MDTGIDDTALDVSPSNVPSNLMAIQFIVEDVGDGDGCTAQ